jgi:ATP-binding cassette, subfamily C (CFTR/MRP), member 2
MALSYGLSLNISFVFSIQNQCQLASQIISVERVHQYMDIPSEAAEIIEENRPAPDWPQVGRVDLKDLKVINGKPFTCLPITGKPFYDLDSSK